MCIATPLWRHNDSGVTKSSQNMDANMFKWEIIWMVRFVYCVSIDFNEIYVNSNKNSGSIFKERAFWIIASHSYDTLRNSWLWYFRNFIIVIARCVNDWIFGTLFKFPCIVRIYAWLFMHCRNHHSDSHANHVIIVHSCPSFTLWKWWSIHGIWIVTATECVSS